MRYRLMATYLGVPYYVGLGPDGNEATLFSAAPPPDELGFVPAGGLWRKQVSVPDLVVCGTSIVTILYLGLNIVFLIAAPREALAGQRTVAHVAATHLFGESGTRHPHGRGADGAGVQRRRDQSDAPGRGGLGTWKSW